MIPVREETELAVRLPVGSCSSGELCALLREHGVHVTALSCFHERIGCVALIITEEPGLATSVLEEAGFTCHRDPALLVGPSPSDPGALVEMGRTLRRAGVGILRSHICPMEDHSMFAVLHTTDNKTALRILNTAGLC
jgi:hypothetical protein